MKMSTKISNHIPLPMTIKHCWTTE